MHHFCTYFDTRFLLRALALHQSLQCHAQPFTLHALCLDQMSDQTVLRLNEPTLRPITLEDLESADDELKQVKPTRSQVEYYFTCTPALTRHVMNRQPDADVVSYVDADLYFFSSPAPVFDEMRDANVLIIGHRYPPALAHFQRYGKYNVGLVSFRRSAVGLACLQSWREQCLQWCYERIEDGRYADQKYLDDWPQRFDGVVELQHKGANLAPWNLTNYKLTIRDGRVWVDDDPLIFYHFHRLKSVGPCLGSIPKMR